MKKWVWAIRRTGLLVRFPNFALFPSTHIKSSFAGTLMLNQARKRNFIYIYFYDFLVALFPTLRKGVMWDVGWNLDCSFFYLDRYPSVFEGWLHRPNTLSEKLWPGYQRIAQRFSWRCQWLYKAQCLKEKIHYDLCMDPETARVTELHFRKGSMHTSSRLFCVKSEYKIFRLSLIYKYYILNI